MYSIMDNDNVVINKLPYEQKLSEIDQEKILEFHNRQIEPAVP